MQIGEMVANMHGQISATGDAFRMAYRIVKTGESLGSVVRFTEGAPQDTNRILPEINGTTFGKVMNVVDQVINSPGNRFVNAVDSFNQTLAYRGYMERCRLKGIAVDDALSSGTLKQQDAAAFVTKMMSNPDPGYAASRRSVGNAYVLPRPSRGVGSSDYQLASEKSRRALDRSVHAYLCEHLQAIPRRTHRSHWRSLQHASRMRWPRVAEIAIWRLAAWWQAPCSAQASPGKCSMAASQALDRKTRRLALCGKPTASDRTRSQPA